MFRIIPKFSSILLLLLVMLSCLSNEQRDYPIQPVAFTNVQITDEFWQPRMEINRTVTIPHAFKKCEETGRLDNFAIAAGLKSGEQQGSYPFDDTDVYKTIEGASYCLMLSPHPKLEAYLDSVIALIAAAQEPDGYLYTARTNKAERLKNWFGEKRWEKLQSSHELYNLGHLYEAAVAHYQAIGKRNLLDVALKSAELLNRTFGYGKLQIPPGHQVIEMGLVKLYRVTGEPKYLNLAKFFLDVRGKPLDGRQLWGEYCQDHKPVIEQDEAVGHAVRAAYMYAGMADVAALTGDPKYARAIDRLWENVVSKKLYITGGIGATGAGEAFGKNYELPNMSAYNETCAAIGNVFWNHRLFLLHGHSKYIDVLERTLYNGLISGVSLDGKSFFYPNPLASVGQHARSPWFGCACCPGNIARFMASIPGYVYAHRDKEIYINLFIDNNAAIRIKDQIVKIQQRTRYPWDGSVIITINPEIENRAFSILIRVPGWALNQPVPSHLYRFLDSSDQQHWFTLNGNHISPPIKHGYAVINKKWHRGDTIELDFPMPIRRIVAHDSVKADRGRVALQRGPIVYCVEWPDVQDGHVLNLVLPDSSKLSSEFRADLLNGVQIITGKAIALRVSKDASSLEKSDQRFLAIPYYAWAHRGRGEMAVWLAREESAAKPLGHPTLASQSKVTVSFGHNPEAIHDQLEPQRSGDHEVPFFHWWDHKGTTEWVQYDFPQPEEVSTVGIYWFDDTGVGECRVPLSWKILYKLGNEWKPVYTEDNYGVAKDRYNEVVFETVRTTALRLEIQSQPGFAGGIHEWIVR
ncbi:MAG: glycoside hydrolase family 127 protein [candidate division KSB1 bacterium]|nr:glycoside hydrolase family 127 protein [candidate division KSB1 bacterium]